LLVPRLSVSVRARVCGAKRVVGRDAGRVAGRLAGRAPKGGRIGRGRVVVVGARRGRFSIT
jgi:hypothetical protein